MHFRLIATLTFALIAGPSFGLSCMRPDAITLYENARDSEDLYSMVIGTIVTGEPIARPKPDRTGQGNGDKFTETRVQLVGRALSSRGFGADFDQTVTLRLSCISAWCAEPPDTEVEVLVALKHVGNDRVIEMSACPSNALAFKPDDEARIMNCHRFEKCDREEF